MWKENIQPKERLALSMPEPCPSVFFLAWMHSHFEMYNHTRGIFILTIDWNSLLLSLSVAPCYTETWLQSFPGLHIWINKTTTGCHKRHIWLFWGLDPWKHSRWQTWTVILCLILRAATPHFTDADTDQTGFFFFLQPLFWGWSSILPALPSTGPKQEILHYGKFPVLLMCIFIHYQKNSYFRE